MRAFPLGFLLWLFLLPLAAQQAPSASSAHGKPHTKVPDAGIITDGVYHNSWFGFTYKIPFGWVERTDSMRDDASDPAKSLALLAVFERPPEVTTGEGVNAAVVIAAESVTSYPGVKQPADYLGVVTQLAAAKGLEADGDPYEFAAGATKLAREDYKKRKGTAGVLQTSLAMNLKGYFVCFTFIAGSEDQIEDLIAGLRFPAVQSSPRK